MRRPIFAFLLCLLMALCADAATGRVIKVLPHFLDLKGRHTVSPSLYDRDAYQALLRQQTNSISGVRFDVQWKARGPAASLKLRVDLRGVARGDLPRETRLEKEVHPGWLSRWTSLPLSGEEYQNFGEVTAWRVTLWDGDQLLGEQKSFLW